MLRRVQFLFGCGVLLGLSTGVQADVKPHGLFDDHAVLQRDMPIPIWGTAENGEKITVKLNGATAETTAADGKWSVKLPAQKAGGPYELTITGPKNEIALKDILIGDVWLCGGQSNMEWRVNQGETPAEVKKGADLPKIRLITIPRGGADAPKTDVDAAWKVCTPETVGDFSAVGFHFGKALQTKLDVPIGLINSNVGGTAAQRWASKEALAANEQTKVYTNQKDASNLYNAMIAPLAPFAVKGAIWYQGESNAGQAERYRALFPVMIEDWRKTFGQPELPFLFVQLAPFKAKVDAPAESDWAELREAQLMTLSKLPKTGMAVITDVGNEKDIHPTPKGPVGERLALAARALAYGEKIEFSGPVYESMKADGDKAILRFSHVGQGLEARGDALTGFTIAGADKVWSNADAKIDGDTVVVRSDKVSKPVAVRFGWANFPVVNFWNKDGLPATPFRTDNWDGVTKGK